MKIRQALKLYGKSKKTLLKIRSIDDEGFVLGGPNRSFRQRYKCKGMRYTSYFTDVDGKKHKTYRYYIQNHNTKAFIRVKKYLKNNDEVSFLNVFNNNIDFEVILKRKCIFDYSRFPEEYKRYYVYDDGKIKPSREGSVYVCWIIPYCSAAKWLTDIFDNDSKEYYWLFGDETDYFIGGANSSNEMIYFARTLDGGWFSIGNNWRSDTGRLDVTGELYKIAHKNDDKEEIQIASENQKGL